MQKPFIFINGRKGFRGTVVKSHRSIAGFSPAKKNHILRGKTHSLIGVVPLLLSVVLSLLLQSCVKRLAVNSIANALTEGSTSVYARDDDPILVGAALPFALKTMETLLEQTPDNKKLLIATAAGFVQYAHAFVLQPASTLEFTDLAAARDERDRARRLFLRARTYALRALELEHDGITQRLTSDPKAAVSTAKPQDIPALYWTGVAWGSAISISKSDMALVGEVPIVRFLLERALVLDPDWEDGAIHEFFIRFDAGRTEAEGGGLAKAESHCERAMHLNGGRSIGPLVALAETVCVRQQDRDRFKDLLNRALTFDVDKYPDKRLANILAQRQAAELLENIDHFFYLDEHAINKPSLKTPN